MFIVINNKEINITTSRELITAASFLNEDDADTLMLALLSDKNEFQHIFANHSDLRAALKDLPKKQATRLVLHITGNCDEFNRLLQNNYLLEAVVANVPDEFAEKIMGYVFSSVHQFQHLYDNDVAFSAGAQRLPEKYARQLAGIVLQHPQELYRLVKNKYALESLLNKMPEPYKTDIARKVIASQEHLALMELELDTFKLLLAILPAETSSILLDNICKSKTLFHTIFNNLFHLQKVVKEFSEQQARELIKAYDDFNHVTALHLAARFKPELVADLARLGSRPLTEKEPENNTLYYLLGHKTCSLELIVSVLKQGADPLTVYRDNTSCLHYAASSLSPDTNKYVPILIKLGADVNATNSRDQTALNVLLAKMNFSSLDIDPALALLQRSDPKTVTSITKTNLLQHIYQLFPGTEHYIAKFVKKQDLNNAEAVFAKINIAALRLYLQSQDPVAQARRNYMNLLLWLVYHRSHNQNGKSFFKNANTNILLRILSFLDFAAMGEKSAQAGIELAQYVFSQDAAIKALTHTPGGISVLQTKSDNKRQFTLFQSVKTLARDYDSYKAYLHTTQHRRHPTYDKFVNKEFTNTSLRQLADYRDTHAAGYLRKNLALFQKSESKLVLMEIIEHTELFNAPDARK